MLTGSSSRQEEAVDEIKPDRTTAVPCFTLPLEAAMVTDRAAAGVGVGVLDAVTDPVGEVDLLADGVGVGVTVRLALADGLADLLGDAVDDGVYIPQSTPGPTGGV